MKTTNILLLDPYRKYIEFVNQQRVLEDGVVYHSHHIIPRCLGGSNSKSNLVQLNVDDHCKAHLLLAECFDKDSYEYLSNIRSANLLDKSSLRNQSDFDNFRESMSGENNPFYGKTHTKEALDKMQETKVKNGTTKKDSTYEELYGDAAEIQKQKRKQSGKKYWETASEDEKEKRRNSIKAGIKPGSRSGANNPYAITLEIDGIIYKSWSDAISSLGISKHKIERNYNVKRLGKTKDIKI